jgi:hypothetical protein
LQAVSSKQLVDAIIFSETKLPDASVIERGYRKISTVSGTYLDSAKVCDPEALAALLRKPNISQNKLKGTPRGM